MPRGIKAKTKRERIERLLRQKWSKERIVATVGCAMSYVYIVKREMLDRDLANFVIRMRQ
jgi:hypothetical protein